jgi:hypothetical protein
MHQCNNVDVPTAHCESVSAVPTTWGYLDICSTMNRRMPATDGMPIFGLVAQTVLVEDHSWLAVPGLVIELLPG